MTADGFVTCLWFDDQAEEAAAYYVSMFKNSRLGAVSRYTEAGPGTPGSVLTVEFTANGQQFVALNGGPLFTFSEAVSFQIMCDDQDEVDHYWDTFVETGGQPGPCGWLKDRYGLSWQVVPTELIALTTDPDQEKAGRATQAMLTMHKIDLAAVRRAHDGE
ncbi:VOC family protein [Streptomyces sp. NPDC091281]|uniref:VOC family protein n=1 Tax=Streptomyces sp. NPDC091281 TaxID=3365985 RepID=UPI003828D67F